MAIKQFNPYTASRRHMTILSRADITKQKPERSLLAGRKKRTGGRNNYGQRRQVRFRSYAQRRTS